jgi:hypothetical protein
VELPITIVVEPPSLAALRVLLRRRWIWVLAAVVLAGAGGALALVVAVSRAEALPTGASIDTRIASRPGGAEVSIDDQSFGATPVSVSLARGAHQVRFKTPDGVDTAYTLDAQPPDAALDALLWRSQPQLRRLRPPLPGAALVDARLQADGAVALSLGLGDDGPPEAWRWDSSSSEQLPFAGAGLSVSPDGGLVASVGPEVGPPAPGGGRGERVVWLSSPSRPEAAPTAAWLAPSGEQLTGVFWRPDSHALLVASEPGDQRLQGSRTRLWLVDLTSGDSRALVSLPSRIVPGAAVWRPDGAAVALLAHAGTLNALSVLDLDGDLRYLADLEPSTGSPLAYPPLTWSPDGQRLVFAAPRQDVVAAPADWPPTQARRVLYVTDAGAAATPRVLAEVDAFAVAFREDGQLVALSRVRDGDPELRLIDAFGHDRRLLALPVPRAETYAAQWDLDRGRLLLAGDSGGRVEYWLAQLALEEQP